MANECKHVLEVAEGPSICTDEETISAKPSVEEEKAYSMRVWIDKPFNEVLGAVKRAVFDAGLEILSEIDARRLFHERLGIKFPHYITLGVCKPEWMRDAIQADAGAGLFLPFNIVVSEHNGGCSVETIDPVVQLKGIGKSKFEDLASMVCQDLHSVIDNVSDELG